MLSILKIYTGINRKQNEITKNKKNNNNGKDKIIKESEQQKK